LKVLFQQNRLVLPRHPGLLRQLSALEYETAEGGTVQIAVPGYRGHDDLAMALMHAGRCTYLAANRWLPVGTQLRARKDCGEVLTTHAGTKIHERPRCHEKQFMTAFLNPWRM
jgi:hypothetical protein